jgi:hypothetical protein
MVGMDKGTSMFLSGATKRGYGETARAWLAATCSPSWLGVGQAPRPGRQVLRHQAGSAGILVSEHMPQLMGQHCQKINLAVSGIGMFEVTRNQFRTARGAELTAVSRGRINEPAVASRVLIQPNRVRSRQPQSRARQIHDLDIFQISMRNLSRPWPPGRSPSMVISDRSGKLAKAPLMELGDALLMMVKVSPTLGE